MDTFLKKEYLQWALLGLVISLIACGGNSSSTDSTEEVIINEPISYEEAPTATPIVAKLDSIEESKPEENVEISNHQEASEKNASSKESSKTKEVKKGDQKKEESRTSKSKSRTSDSEKRKSRRDRRRAKIEFKETIYDFGRIDQGQKVKHDFVFKNVGKGDLEILNVDVTCGCTVPTFPFIPIAPGEEGTISVTYNSTGKLGNQKPMITIITNTKPSKHQLYMKGVVDAERANTTEENVKEEEGDL